MHLGHAKGEKVFIIQIDKQNVQLELSLEQYVVSDSASIRDGMIQLSSFMSQTM
jgi:hypothetical protein